MWNDAVGNPSMVLQLRSACMVEVCKQHVVSKCFVMCRARAKVRAKASRQNRVRNQRVKSAVMEERLKLSSCRRQTSLLAVEVCSLLSVVVAVVDYSLLQCSDCWKRLDLAISSASLTTQADTGTLWNNKSRHVDGQMEWMEGQMDWYLSARWQLTFIQFSRFMCSFVMFLFKRLTLRQ